MEGRVLMHLNYHILGAGAATLGFVLVCCLFALACDWFMAAEQRALEKWLDEHARQRPDDKDKK
jgi:hypothetical protein